jgi:hypothetical protein
VSGKALAAGVVPRGVRSRRLAPCRSQYLRFDQRAHVDFAGDARNDLRRFASTRQSLDVYKALQGSQLQVIPFACLTSLLASLYIIGIVRICRVLFGDSVLFGMW